MLISKAFYRHLPIFLNLFKCPLRGLICKKSEQKDDLNRVNASIFYAPYGRINSSLCCLLLYFLSNRITFKDLEKS
jgi:hypothetical protein